MVHLIRLQIEHLKACSEIASSRINNWQEFCLQETGIMSLEENLCFMIRMPLRLQVAQAR